MITNIVPLFPSHLKSCQLEPGDHILSVNGEDVKETPRDHVIQLVRSCESKVTLVVCQPSMSGTMGRKSTFLSAGKKAKLRTRPSRVRFAESVCVNGAPLFPVSSQGDHPLTRQSCFNCSTGVVDREREHQ